MSDNNFQKLEDILINSTNFLSEQLVIAALYLITFESIKRVMRDSIIRLNSFPQIFNGKIIHESKNSPLYSLEIINGKMTRDPPEPLIIENDPEFKDLLESKYAPEKQANYLLEQKIIDIEEAKLIKKLFKEERNNVAHHLLKILIDDSVPSLDLKIVRKVALIAHKIENYIMKYIDTPVYIDTWEEVPFDLIGESVASAETHLLHNIIDICETYIEKHKI